MLDRWFREHPRSVGETYLEHLAVAASFGARLLSVGLACLVHAVVPRLFTCTASRAIADLHGRMTVARTRPRPAPSFAPDR
jgi:hypothetical protein